MLKTIVSLKGGRKSLPISLLSYKNYSINAKKLFESKLQQIKDEKISEPENSMELIFADVLKKSKLREVRGDSLENVELTEEQKAEIEEKVLCRLSHMPVQFLLKSWNFRDIKLKMQLPVFIPRPETEELVELVSQKIDLKENYKILEVGCGTGCISLSILHEHPNISQIIAIDQSKAACELTLENAKSLNLSDRLKIFKHKLDGGQLPEQIINDEKFDFIISNPPYVPSKDMLKLEPEIYLYEDMRALDGGKDGLDVIKMLLELSTNYLKTGGNLFLEVDHRHPEIIAKIIENSPEMKLKFNSTYKDIFQKDRFVEIEKI